MRLNEPIMFVDLSYFIFYRYFALYNWFKLSQQREPNAADLESEQLFLEKYTKMFLQTLAKLQKQCNVQTRNVFLAADCSRCNIWRMKEYPEYKGTRATENMREFNGYIFQYTFDNILKKHREYTVMSVPEAEADDIIGTWVKSIRQRNPQHAPLHIITNDQDYLQLAGPNTFITNLRGQDLTAKSIGSPELDVRMKILTGDTSDNIPSVFTRVPKKKLLEWAQNHDQLESAFAQYAGSRERYELNRRLIDMDFIPDRIKEKIEALAIMI
jgi:5'-3' exonuclease